LGVDVRTLFDETEEGPLLRVHVQPGGGRTQVTGTYGTALKVRVAAPPEAGRANDAVLKLIAESLDVDLATLGLTSGDHSRHKRILLKGAESATLVRALEELLAGDPRKRSGGRKRP
jgi:uncharacterized protein (TIGR00251 family)